MDESVKTHLLKSPDNMTKERRQIKEFSWVHVELQVGYEILSQNEFM